MKKHLEHIKDLGQERTLLSNERTMLAHLRTSFSFFLFGIGILKFFEKGAIFYLAYLFCIIGAVLFFIGFFLFFNRRNRIEGYRKKHSKINRD